MLSCLGIYVDRNIIKYAKVKKVRDFYDLEAYNVETYENLPRALRKVVEETNSYKIPVCVNISNELYNYFDVFSALEKKDITKSLDIEFEMMCNDKGYDKKQLDSRYILMENKENYDKYKAIYISGNKKQIDEEIDVLSNYKLFSITPATTSITNLVDINEKENVAILNIENETKVTTVIEGQISRIDILKSGLEEVVEKINKIEMSLKKAYNVFKNITIYSGEVEALDDSENEYIDIVMPVINQIALETKKLLGSFNEKIDKLYITGMGATINNIDLYLQEYMKNTKCEILKPFFVDSTSNRIPIKEYIEVNSATALALDGLGFINKDLNFAPLSKLDDNIDDIKNSKEEFDIHNWKEYFKEPYSLKEKVLVRAIVVLLLFIVGYSIVSTYISSAIEDEISVAKAKLVETTSEINRLDSELAEIQKHVDAYSSLIASVDSLNQAAQNAQNSRVVPKDAIPNFMNKIMFIIPQKVQVISIKNTEGKHMVIEAVSEDYEQLGYFTASLTTEGALNNVQYNQSTKVDSLVQVTIEGDLP